jgi:hypothetical protein
MKFKNLKVCEKAVSNDERSIEYVPDFLITQNFKKFFVLLDRNLHLIFSKNILTMDLFNDKNFCIEVIKKRSYFIEQFNPNFKKDIDVCMNLNFSHFLPEMKLNRELFLKKINTKEFWSTEIPIEFINDEEIFPILGKKKLIKKK